MNLLFGMKTKPRFPERGLFTPLALGDVPDPVETVAVGITGLAVIGVAV